MVKLETPLSELMVRQHGSGPLGDGLEFVVTAAHHRYGRIILTAGQQRVGHAIFPPIVSRHMPARGVQAHERAVHRSVPCNAKLILSPGLNCRCCCSSAVCTWWSAAPTTLQRCP